MAADLATRPSPPPRASLLTKLAVAGPILFFVGLGCLWIDHPGLHYDETLFVTASYPDAQRGGHGYLEIFGRPFCLMVLPYLGALKGWLYRVVFDFFGASAAAVRVPVIFLGAFTLLLLFFLARRAFDARTGLLAVALAASDPTFLFTTRLDWGPVVIQRLSLVAGFLLLLRWQERATSSRLFAAFFVLGIGLFDKLTFVWLLVAAAVSVLILFPREMTSRVSPKALAAALAGFALGCLPLIAYRVIAAPASLGLRWERDPQIYLAKLSMLYHSLDGTIFQGWFANVAAPQPVSLAGLPAFARYWLDRDALIDPAWTPWALAAAVLLLPWTLRAPHRRGLLFVLIFCVAAVALMIPVESAGSAHHLTLIYPLPHVFLAATLSIAVGWMRGAGKQRWGRMAIAAIVCLLLITNVRATIEQYGQILRFGGTPPWSEAIYPLYDVLKSKNPGGIVVLDWGIAMQLRLLSRDSLSIKEAPQQAEEKYRIEAIRRALEQPRPLFVGYDASVPLANLRTRALLEETAAASGRRLQRAARIEDLQGRPTYEIFAAE